jgi:hypothetical protein
MVKNSVYVFDGVKIMRFDKYFTFRFKNCPLSIFAKNGLKNSF